MFSRFFGGSKKKKNANEEIDVDISGATTGKNGSVQYLTRDEVYVLRLAHDFLLEQFSAGGSNFGVQASLAKRELGGEVVCLTEMWLDRQEVGPLVMKESGKGLWLWVWLWGLVVVWCGWCGCCGCCGGCGCGGCCWCCWCGWCGCCVVVLIARVW